MVAKDNQPELRQAIAGLLATPSQVPGVTPLHQATTVDRGHSRLDQRTLRVRALLPGDGEWPGAAQVFQIERHRLQRRTGVLCRTVVYGVTSLSAEEAAAPRLLRLLRGHWAIEQRTHWVRDVTCDEDRSPVRSGATPRVRATPRTLASSLRRRAGATNIAAACRRCAAQPWRALALIGIRRQ